MGVMERARFDPRGYPWIMPQFKYAWIFMVPGKWNSDNTEIWRHSEFAPIQGWLEERCCLAYYCEINGYVSDLLATPVEVHLKSRRDALMFALTWG